MTTDPETTSYQRLQADLFPEEKLLWHDRPVQGIRFQRSDLVWIFFGLVFLITAIGLILQEFNLVPIPSAWLVNSTILEMKLSIGFWIILLLTIAILFLGGSHWLDARKRRHFFYGVTNERILILHDRRRGAESLISLRIHDVPHLSLKVAPDGIGSLSFTGGVAVNQTAGSPLAAAFYLIPEVRKVYALIRSIQRESV